MKRRWKVWSCSNALKGSISNRPPGVAVASLKQAIRTGAVETDAVIMLNITGGGIAKFKKENKVVYKQPDCVFALDTDPDTIKETVMELFI